MNRRQFVRSSLAAVVALGSRHLHGGATPRAIGLQMYTVREQAEQNLPAVLQAISKIGYQEVELYWTLYSHPAPELRRMLADHGLRPPSGHVDYKGFESKLE